MLILLDFWVILAHFDPIPGHFQVVTHRRATRLLLPGASGAVRTRWARRTSDHALMCWAIFRGAGATIP